MLRSERERKAASRESNPDDSNRMHRNDLKLLAVGALFLGFALAMHAIRGEWPSGFATATPEILGETRYATVLSWEFVSDRKSFQMGSMQVVGWKYLVTFEPRIEIFGFRLWRTHCDGAMLQWEPSAGPQGIRSAVLDPVAIQIRRGRMTFGWRFEHGSTWIVSFSSTPFWLLGSLVFIFAITSMAVRLWRGAPAGHCPYCHYDLGGLGKGARCPECGGRTALTDRQQNLRRRAPSLDQGSEAASAQPREVGAMSRGEREASG
ncbi:MAG: hypothetical protein EA376_06270 [Phycisphaeraceae bacterium]|nr:MAG: hypothetical protein EA376_06270 [Phycisphaeraceae bacterium]